MSVNRNAKHLEWNVHYLSRLLSTSSLEDDDDLECFPESLATHGTHSLELTHSSASMQIQTKGFQSVSPPFPGRDVMQF